MLDCTCAPAHTHVCLRESAAALCEIPMRVVDPDPQGSAPPRCILLPHRPTAILLTLTNMQADTLTMPRRLPDTYAPMLRGTVRELAIFDRAFGRGIPRFLEDYAGAFEKRAVLAGINREAVKV